MFRLLLVAVTAAISLGAQARSLTSAQKLEDFHILQSVINANYGPLEYKMTNKIIDLTTLNAKFENLIANSASNRDFYYLLVQYVAGYKDGHFGISVPSDVMKTVPVVTDLVDGKVLITKIDRNKLSVEKFKFDIGDEILSVDGQPIKDYLDNVSTYIPDGREQSARRSAAWTVFFRRAARLPIPAEAKLKVEIRRGTSDVIETAEVEWTMTGTALDESGIFTDNGFTSFSLINSFTQAGQKFDNFAVTERMDFIPPSADRDFSCSGTTRITTPADATVIMTEPFVAYYHPTAKGNIGYLRIPHYNPTPSKPGETQNDATMAWISQYEYAVQKLEENTVGLILDQDHNCGGSVWVVNKIVSMFMDKPFKGLEFELLANKESYMEFKEWTDSTPANTMDRFNMTKVLDLIYNTWTRGTSRLTPKIPIDGNDAFQPNGIRYSKPVVMLIDEMSGSGGDAFPGMMKGLGRAKLFGQTTSGLGGHVQNYPAGLPNSQMKFRITKSLFYRPDGVPIENNGAVPDQTYVIQRDDVLYGFKAYQKAYLAYLNQLLP